MTDTSTPAIAALIADPILDTMIVRLLTTAKLLYENAVGCAVNRYGEDFVLHGKPGWLSDCEKDILAAEKAADMLGARIATLEAQLADAREELKIWQSVFPDIAPRDVLPDRSALEADLATATAENAILAADRDRLRAALEPFVEVADGMGWDKLQSEELVHVIGPRLSAGCYIEAGTFRRARAVLNPEDA